jgi:hypothetical protein
VRPSRELRAEVVDEAPVGRGRGVVELVDDDVVERVAREALQVGDAAEGLDRGEEDPAELGAVGVEGAEPGLAEAGGEDDEAGGLSMPIGPDLSRRRGTLRPRG